MINYKHLHYFMVVAKQGSIARASEQLHLTPQTISAQLSLLEESLGGTLFKRVGRNLQLTDIGRTALGYAEEIFSLGGELEGLMRNLPADKPLSFKVGIADVVPKSIAYRLLAPALELSQPLRMVCRENSIDALLGELALHRLDLVIADEPIPTNINVRGYNHQLGECGISFLAAPKLAQELEGEFPQCLDAAPMMMPSDVSVIQSQLLKWFDKLRIRPKVVAEFDDSALMKAFGQAGTGVFPAPTAIVDEVVAKYGVVVIGQISEVREKFYAISVERKISHPAVAVISKTAREWLFREAS